MEKKKEREKWLDILKGIAILLIIVGHSPINETLYKLIWSFHVPLFFLISGYTFSKKEEKEFIKGKFRRLMVPYYFTCFLLIIANIISDMVTNAHNINILNIFKTWIWAGIYGSCWPYHTPFEIYSIGAIWFLCTLFASLLLFNFVMNQDEKYHTVLIAILVYIGFTLNKFMWLPFNFASACVCTLLLYVGYLARKHEILNSKSIVLNIVLFIIAFLCIINQSMTIVGNNTYSYGLFSIFGAISISYFVARFAKLLEKVPIVCNSLSYLGKYTMILLCFHLIELDFIFGKNIIPISNGFLNVSVLLILRIAWGLLFIQIVKHTPLKKIFC